MMKEPRLQERVQAVMADIKQQWTISVPQALVPKKSGELLRDLKDSTTNAEQSGTTMTLHVASTKEYSEKVNERTGFFDNVVGVMAANLPLIIENSTKKAR